jgi:hypothetical protein
MSATEIVGLLKVLLMAKQEIPSGGVRRPITAPLRTPVCDDLDLGPSFRKMPGTRVLLEHSNGESHIHDDPARKRKSA